MLFLTLVVTPVHADDVRDGLDALNNKDYKTALMKLMLVAGEGDAKAQNMLGEMYWNGPGVFRKIIKKLSSGTNLLENRA